MKTLRRESGGRGQNRLWSANDDSAFAKESGKLESKGLVRKAVDRRVSWVGVACAVRKSGEAGRELSALNGEGRDGEHSVLPLRALRQLSG
jgi:hypothetical protein